MTNFIMSFLGALTGGFIVSYLFLMEMDRRYIKKGDGYNGKKDNDYDRFSR